MKKVLEFLKIQKYLVLILASLTVLLVVNIISHSQKEKKETEDKVKAIEVISSTKENLVVEVGSILPEIKEYFKNEEMVDDNATIAYFYDGEEIEETELCKLQNKKCITNRVDDFKVVIKNNDEEYKSNLLVVDTTAPEVKTKEVVKTTGDKYSVQEFIKTYTDNSGSKDYNANFVDENQADITDIGTTAIKLRVCDLSHNCIEVDSRLVIEKQKENPVTTPSKPSSSKPSSSKPSSSKPSSSKPSSSKPSSGSSGGSSGSGSGSSGSGGSSTTPKTCTEQDKVEKLITHQKIIYGTQENKYVNVTYHIGKTCTKTEVSRTGEKSEVVYSTFNGTVKTMKSEASSIQSSISGVKNTILNLTNNYRAEAGASALKLDNTLSILATIRCMEMAYSNTFSHTRPNGKAWYTVWDDYGLAKGSVIGENLGKGYSTPEGVSAGWKNSPSHYKNLVNTKFTKIGIGKYTYQGVTYWAQEFSS